MSTRGLLPPIPIEDWAIFQQERFDQSVGRHIERRLADLDRVSGLSFVRRRDRRPDEEGTRLLGSDGWLPDQPEQEPADTWGEDYFLRHTSERIAELAAPPAELEPTFQSPPPARPLPSEEERAALFRQSAGEGFPITKAPPSPEPPPDWLPAAEQVARQASRANEWLRESLPPYAALGDVAGRAIAGLQENVIAPQAETVYGPMVRREVLLSPTQLAESAARGVGRLGRETVEEAFGPGRSGLLGAGASRAWEAAGQRWQETEAPFAVKGLAEATVPTELLLGFAPLEKVPGAGLQAARAVGRAMVNPEVQRSLAALGRFVPRLGIEAVERAGNVVRATGADPNRAYEFRFVLRDLDELIPSHTDRLTTNPAFPRELQPRLRERAASELQIDKMAKELNPDALLADVGTLDRGPMIVAPDNVVESGNGRVLALRRARQLYPERFADYEGKLSDRLAAYGIDPQATQGMRNPVLVRERLSEVNRPTFAAEANESPVLAMSPFEAARQDAGRIDDALLGRLDVGEAQSINQALLSASNRPLVRAFVDAVPTNERAALVDAHGALNQAGLERLKAALFARTYAGAAGQRLTQSFFESLDPTAKMVEQGMFALLPQMARAEELIRAGYRDAALSLGEDLSKAVDMLARLRQQGVRVDDYLRQAAMFERELTPLQERLLGYLTAVGRSPKRVREFIGEYARAVEEAPAAAQAAMFADVAPTKEAIVERVIQRAAAEEAERSPLFAAGRGAAEAPEDTAAAAARPQLAGRPLTEGAGPAQPPQLGGQPPELGPKPPELGPKPPELAAGSMQAPARSTEAAAQGSQPPAATAPVPSPRPRPEQPITPARVLPELQRPERPLPRMFEEQPPVREQAGIPGMEPPEAGIVPPGQGRLPMEGGRRAVPPGRPTRRAEPPVAPEPPPDDGILPRFPTNEELEARLQQGGWLRRLSEIGARVPGAKAAIGVADPWAVAQSHVERVPLVFRQMEAMGGDIVRNALAYLEAIRLPGVEIKGGRFIAGVRPKTPGLSLAVSDVLEHIGQYDTTPELLQFAQTANRLNDDLLKWAKAEGVKLRQMQFEEGGHYFGRLVREVRDVEKRGRMRPDMPRHYDSMEAGIQEGVVYEDSLLATAEAGYSYLLRKIIAERMKKMAAQMGRTPKQLIPEEITARAVLATQELRGVHNYERTLKAMRDGMEPRIQVRTPGAAPGERLRSQLTAVDKTLPGTSARVLETWNRVKDMPVADATRQAAFKKLIEEAGEIRKRATTEYNTATAERAKAMRSLQSPEYAEGAKFGLPEGTIGVGPVYQGWAAGRVFPREVADALNRAFGETAHKVMRAMNTVSGTSRTLVAGFDFGTAAIQLQPLMFSHPVVWGRAFANMFAATAMPQVYKAYRARPENLTVLKKLIPHGLSIEGAEYAEAAERGGALYRAAGLVPKIGKGIQEQFLGRAEMAFQAPLNVAKIELAKALLPVAERQGQLDELAAFLNNVTGTRSSLAAGIGPGQRSIESAALFFSPRFTRSTLALAGDALQGGLKGSEARRALASLLVGGLMATAGLRLALGQPVTPQFFDPSNPEFMTAELFRRRVGLGGPYRALAVLLATSYKTAQQNPGSSST